MTIGTSLYTWWRGELVGSDAYGNRYYRERGQAALKKGGGIESRERRWVIYQGAPEASKVPPEWHGWLHHIVDAVPGVIQTRPWQKPHLPNLTGTAQAYRPAGSLLKTGKRAAAASDYEAWTP